MTKKMREMSTETLIVSAETGDVEAMIVLAERSHSAHDFEAADKWIRCAQSSLKADDKNGLVELWSAIKWLGNFDYIEAEKLSKEYLIRLGEMDNLVAQHELMASYLDGLNGFPKNIERFAYWAERAKKAGSKIASKQLKKYIKTVGLLNIKVGN